MPFVMDVACCKLGPLLHGHWPVTQDKNGCLVIQEALESATWEMQMPIMTELKGKVCLGCLGPSGRENS